jgi:hypothetical protein
MILEFQVEIREFRPKSPALLPQTFDCSPPPHPPGRNEASAAEGAEGMGGSVLLLIM